ncbi:MAG: ATP-binding protein [Nitrosomonas sp.]|uniref:ATP-binding protein n=1 Tax=Nitrosomonas sp. TaxID=42353 RepID=UPI0027355C44|nr:ATP-binding protein [Nitrosomonas sp.]MDP3664798.1 ATP-binding protein [Nitrosomonas sp.]MDZ4106644.1 ATP-binding protein [Nitrosomonas sp.]
MFPAVALLGPRQAGKTTLALEIAKDFISVYLDLESEEDRAKLASPAYYLESHKNKLVILDEVQRIPGIFRELRGIIDKNRRTGKPTGQFLLLGFASIDLLLVRKLPPLQNNLGKRLIKSPKVYILNSVLLLALLGIDNKETLPRAPCHRHELGRVCN